MAIPTEKQIRARLKEKFETLPDYGIVETRKRLADDVEDEDFIRLIRGLNPGRVATGWIITYVGFTAEKDDCLKRKTLRYQLERIREYTETDGDGPEDTGYELFLGDVEAAEAMLDAEDMDYLGFTPVDQEYDIEHGFLQAPNDFITKRWGEGGDSAKAHYADLTLEVILTHGR